MEWFKGVLDHVKREKRPIIVNWLPLNKTQYNKDAERAYFSRERFILLGPRLRDSRTFKVMNRASVLSSLYANSFPPVANLS